MNLTKLISILFFITLFIFPHKTWAKSHKKKKHKKVSSSISQPTNNKNTAYSMCSRIDPNSKDNSTQTIIVAMETLSEKSCQNFALKKANQYTAAGWTCVGKNNEELFSCEVEKSSTFAIFNGNKLDHLTFTSLQKHRGLVAYIKPIGLQLCHEDQEELKLAGVKDATCHQRQENSISP
jgi:hypothetical protein